MVLARLGMSAASTPRSADVVVSVPSDANPPRTSRTTQGSGATRNGGTGVGAGVGLGTGGGTCAATGVVSSRRMMGAKTQTRTKTATVRNGRDIPPRVLHVWKDLESRCLPEGKLEFPRDDS